MDRRESVRGQRATLLQYMTMLLLSLMTSAESLAEVTLSVHEEQDAGIFIGNIEQHVFIEVNDGETLTYELLNNSEYVTLDEETGYLYTTKHRIDRENICPIDNLMNECMLELDVIVKPDEYFKMIKVNIIIEDINDNAPYFPEENIVLFIPENSPVFGAPFGTDNTAIDKDFGINANLSYHLENDNGFFSVKKEGSLLLVTVKKQLDRETQDIHEMKLIAMDAGSPPLSGTATLIVHIEDANDNCPTFAPSDSILVKLPENEPPGNVVARVQATDADLGSNAEISYSYSPRVSETSKKLFHLDSSTGIITLLEGINKETPLEHKLTVYANGELCPPATAVVTVVISQIFIGQPVIGISYIASQDNDGIVLKENEPEKTAVAIFEVNNSKNIPYVLYIEGDVPFILKPYDDKYLLMTSKPLDFELEKYYDVFIVANDSTRPGVQHKKFLKVKVTDVNDNPPQFTQDVFEFFIEENNKADASLGKVSATDEDSDENGLVLYHLGPEALQVFCINEETGDLTVRTVLDREKMEMHKIEVFGVDQGNPSLSTSTTVTIHVLDQNDNHPHFITSEFSFFIPENFPLLGEIGIINASDADTGLNGQIIISIVNSSNVFVMDNVRGVLRCSADIDREKEDLYEIWLTAKDSGTPALSSTAKVTIFVLDINDNAPKVLVPKNNLSCLPVPVTAKPGSTLAGIYAVDIDSGMNAVMNYRIIGAENQHTFSLFQIDPSTGNISLQEQIAIDNYGMHCLLIEISDSGLPKPLQSTVWVNLYINKSSGPCELQAEPNLTISGPFIEIQGRCGNQFSEIHCSQLTFIIGLSMMMASTMFCFVGTCMFINARRTNKKNYRTQNCEDSDIPLKLNQNFNTKDWTTIQ
ncbi:protocadherin-20 [Polypterus senegalus]|nr:protocadherin-20 [Polypterus senegalus]